MTFAFVFWLIFLLCFIAWLVGWRYQNVWPQYGYGSYVIVFVLLAILGWAVFGPPIHG